MLGNNNCPPLSEGGRIQLLLVTAVPSVGWTGGKLHLYRATTMNTPVIDELA
jgi:hypothetical protein